MNFRKQDSAMEIFQLEVSNEKCFNYFRDLCLFSEPSNYCFDRAAPGQMPKHEWRNTVTMLRALVKCNKCLKETELLLKSCSCKRLF